MIEISTATPELKTLIRNALDVPGNDQLDDAEAASKIVHAGVGDGVTNNDAELTAVSNDRLGMEVVLPVGDYLTTGAFDNEGALFKAPARILKTVGSEVAQVNTYADESGLWVGLEYLHALRVASKGNPGWNIKIFGDSTATNGYVSAAYTISEFIKRAYAINGMSMPTVTNLAVSSTKISDMNAVPQLGATTHWICIKYGINDGTEPVETRLATFAAAMDAKLAAIRADANGGLGNLSILLVGPTSTYDLTNGRDSKWYEQLRAVYVAAARKHHCAYFDAYAYMQDSVPLGGLSYDLPLGDGVSAIHYGDDVQASLWGRIFADIYPPCATGPFARNIELDYRSDEFNPSASYAPSLWNQGRLTFRCQASSGWPMDGIGRSIRQSDGLVEQRVSDYTTGQFAFRTSKDASTWNDWQFLAIPNYGGSANRLASEIPSAWPFGMSVARATTTNGWPLDGQVETVRNVDLTAVQRNYSYTTSTVQFRTGYAGSWNAWV